MRPLAVALALASLLAAGCGGAQATSGGDEVLTVQEALDTHASGSVRVRGSVVADDDATRLCYALAESYPPQCGRPFLRVEGLDLAALDGLSRHEGVRWTDAEVVVAGELEDDVLRNASPSP